MNITCINILMKLNITEWKHNLSITFSLSHFAVVVSRFLLFTLFDVICKLLQSSRHVAENGNFPVFVIEKWKH